MSLFTIINMKNKFNKLFENKLYPDLTNLIYDYTYLTQLHTLDINIQDMILDFAYGINHVKSAQDLLTKYNIKDHYRWNIIPTDIMYIQNGTVILYDYPIENTMDIQLKFSNNYIISIMYGSIWDEKGVSLN